jgi:hypothetical protein
MVRDRSLQWTKVNPDQVEVGGLRVAIVLGTGGIKRALSRFFAAPEREETAEGIELDLVVSYLSRLVIVRGVAPRLGKNRDRSRPLPRVFVMGFPGTGALGGPTDHNAGRSYQSMPVHMNTVAGNEILVIDSAKRYPNAEFFGLNPGLVRTNIRSNILGAGTFRFRAIAPSSGLTDEHRRTYLQASERLLEQAGLRQ